MISRSTLVQNARAAAAKAREGAAAADREGDIFLAVFHEADGREFDRIASEVEAGGPLVDVMLGGFLTPQSAGWGRVWGEVVARYGDVECRCPETGEVWQYMGSAHGEHQFRHRSLKGERVYFSVLAEPVDFETVAEEACA